MEKGKFIVVEGTGDGVGKSTLARSLAEHLNRRGIDVWSTYEIGDSGGIGKTIRKWVVNQTDLQGAKLDPVAEFFLVLADRAQHAAAIRESLEMGTWVICDRYTLSTIAYQGLKLNLDNNTLRQICFRAENEVHPDLTIILDLPVERMKERMAGRTLDHFELRSEEERERTRHTYLYQVENFMPENRKLLLDATNTPEQLLQAVVRKLFPA